MSARYAPLPNPRTDPDAQNEMEAAFDDSEDEDEHNTSESHPLNPSAPSHRHNQSTASPPAPGTYDFENFDYASFPPPGSPPGPSDRALPNDYGNSNGYVPDEPVTDAGSSRGGGGWFGRAAAILPTHFVQRLRRQRVPSGPVGGGLNNDGVFANVTAKPSRGVRVTEGDQTFIVPEEAQKDAPPSYAAAQADAVPPYWETTVHAPSSPSSPGEIIIDSLPTGSLFSFLWNMLVSISFQFVGFLLTYLLHTTHAARLGSRAGLGVTLIQYGFALRNRAESGFGGGGDLVDGGNDANGNPWSQPAAVPTFSSAQEADEYWNGLTNSTLPDSSEMPPNSAMMISDMTTEWLSFFLMTVGWFILLTSVVGFYRVKLWERNILSSQRESSQPPPPSSQPYLTQIERVFGIQAPGSLFRAGLGLGGTRSGAVDPEVAMIEEDEELQEARERARLMASGEREREMMAGIDPNDPDAVRRVAEAYAQEARLHQELREAGLL
ncbi:hypothetical protein GLOTRDRAFT_125716 [Gloeophyllum trabeum ATCC 11539]|uniref:Uncharacterized protein n=1 Tax=Gloeophyllum trabeum (strain ATCC 11539 / FP-39264 / Madison 617) TaxID=670483 RepID=S7S102_GLOTA|nr:uncharacterized protein GLOTRDRAFT_125716 [Gloeophyllum trabeum ATCC 11539]EPQ59409.1 hypothetical protein GLOTRDRAFT_125716 [Gloeophyllum trabeum ATCC 11539]